MLKAPFNLKKSRILLSNDDGIDAPGLKILETIARTISDDVWVVAPLTEQSATGHSLTLRRPLRILSREKINLPWMAPPQTAFYSPLTK